MILLSNAFVFFDIGNTLASVRVSATGNRIEEIVAYPDTSPVLSALRDQGVRLGILSDPGPIPEQQVNEALDRAGLLSFLRSNFVALRFQGHTAPVRTGCRTSAPPRRAGGRGEANPAVRRRGCRRTRPSAYSWFPDRATPPPCSRRTSPAGTIALPAHQRSTDVHAQELAVDLAGPAIGPAPPIGGVHRRAADPYALCRRRRTDGVEAG